MTLMTRINEVLSKAGVSIDDAILDCTIHTSKASSAEWKETEVLSKWIGMVRPQFSIAQSIIIEQKWSEVVDARLTN